jgi:hypothetical protein
MYKPLHHPSNHGSIIVWSPKALDAMTDIELEYLLGNTKEAQEKEQEHHALLHEPTKFYAIKKHNKIMRYHA